MSCNGYLFLMVILLRPQKSIQGWTVLSFLATKRNQHRGGIQWIVDTFDRLYKWLDGKGAPGRPPSDCDKLLGLLRNLMVKLMCSWCHFQETWQTASSQQNIGCFSPESYQMPSPCMGFWILNQGKPKTKGLRGAEITLKWRVSGWFAKNDEGQRLSPLGYLGQRTAIQGVR